MYSTTTRDEKGREHLPIDTANQNPDYVFKTKPFEHQLGVFNRSRDSEVFALLMEQGTGKTKVEIDSAAWLFQRGEIDGVLVIAPNGVHHNWVAREFPAHFPDGVPVRSHVWSSSRTKQTKVGQRELALVTGKGDGLAVLAMNVEMFSGRKGESPGFQEAKKFLKAGRRLAIVDESSWIKTPNSSRTKYVCRLRRYAPFRRILCGTAVTESPFDLYSQFRFLDPDILGFDSFYAFKHEFAEWRNAFHGDYEELVGYRNLDVLKSLIAPHAYRVTKEECLDLPPKTYQRRPLMLSPEQSSLYQRMARQHEVEHAGGRVTAKNILTVMLRLQQIAGGFLPSPLSGAPGDDWDPDPTEAIPGRNPKLEAMVDCINEGGGRPTIVWARFKAELSAIVNRLAQEFGHETVVEYSGRIKTKDRERGVDRFQDPADPARFFVGQTRAGGYGLTLTAASTVMYYSNYYGLEPRQQSEDRAHRIGQDKKVTYIDLEALGTVDAHILEALERKQEMADYMMDLGGAEAAKGDIIWGRLQKSSSCKR